MFVELHVIQNFAPSNLNRDDTGAPKDCDFGGYRRARISSQSLKRAARTYFATHDLMPAENMAVRTKRLVDGIAADLVTAGKGEAETRAVVTAALAGLELKVGDEDKTQYLLFLGRNEVAALTQLCSDHWDALIAIVAPAPTEAGDTAGSGRGRRKAKQLSRDAVPLPVRAALKRILTGGKAADLALFGRMIADLPEHNVEAASQVAHALSTHAVSTEFDFYTAVDDLRPGDTSGADMLGTVEFNSACFYRYANVHVDELVRNLGGDGDLARRTLEAFLTASVLAIPTGKQNSMAAQNPPSFVLAVVREHGLWSLANAFVKPVRPTRDLGLIDGSVATLDAYWGSLTRTYGDDGIVGAFALNLDAQALSNLGGRQVDTLSTLVDQTSAAAFGGNGVSG